MKVVITDDNPNENTVIEIKDDNAQIKFYPNINLKGDVPPRKDAYLGIMIMKMLTEADNE